MTLNPVLASHYSIFEKNESGGESCGSFTEVMYCVTIFYTLLSICLLN